MSDTTTGAAWSEDDSTRYRDLARVAVPDREGQITALLTLLPFDVEETFHVVELASGEGLLAAAILERFPHATLLALDGSPSMRAATQQRLRPFGERAEVAAFDIASSDWYDRLDGAAAVVSSLCIHHLNGQQKQDLFRAISARLAPRGALLIADLVQPQRPEPRTLFADGWDHSARAQSLALTSETSLYDRFVATEWNYYRHPDPADQPSPLFEQLLWLKAAGFAVVDCFWLHAGHAIYGGYKSTR